MNVVAEIGAVPAMRVGVLVGVNANILAAVRWDTPAPIEELRCGAAFSRWPMIAFDCALVVQARMPSNHV